MCLAVASQSDLRAPVRGAQTEVLGVPHLVVADRGLCEGASPPLCCSFSSHMSYQPENLSS